MSKFDFKYNFSSTLEKIITIKPTKITYFSLIELFIKLEINCNIDFNVKEIAVVIDEYNYLFKFKRDRFGNYSHLYFNGLEISNMIDFKNLIYQECFIINLLFNQYDFIYTIPKEKFTIEKQNEILSYKLIYQLYLHNLFKSLNYTFNTTITIKNLNIMIKIDNITKNIKTYTINHSLIIPL